MVSRIKLFLYRYFKILEHNSTLRKEFLAGITNYFTTIYLVILVPEILMNSFQGAIDSNGNLIGSFMLSNGITAIQMFVALTAASFICSGIASIIMGTLTNLPFIQGPSLAIGTFITFTVCGSFGYSYNQALAIVLISGICFFVLAIFGVEKKIDRSIPQNIKYAVTCGIGLFIAYQGFIKSHIIEKTSNNINLFDLANINSSDTKTALLTIAGVILITILYKKRVHGAIFLGKIVCILLAFPLGLVNLNNIKSAPKIDMNQILFNLDFNGILSFTNAEAFFKSLGAVLIVLFSICIMDIFETMVMIIVSENFVKASNEGFENKRIPQILEIDALTTSVGASIGAVTVSTYIESTTGIIEGGRTGLTAVVTGVLFLLTTLFSPLVTLIPSAGTATTLIIAGVLMMKMIKLIDFENIDSAVPAFLTMILMPLTNSILAGISIGIISHLIIQIFLGKWKSIKKMLYVLSLLFLISLIYLPR